MAEKQMTLSGFKSTVPAMKFLATGELDRTPPSCIPRLCQVTVSNLQVLQPLGSDLSSVSLAVKMLSSKRTLRSHEIPLDSDTAEIGLQLSFSMQYPHFLKRDGNTLQIILQRRKKYKNRTFLGYKTLAVGLVNMAQVLQRPVDRILDLYCEGKEKGNAIAIARVSLESLSSQPVDSDDPPERTKFLLHEIADRAADMDDSDDDEDYSSNDDVSDSEPILDGSSAARRRHRHHHHRHLRSNSRAKNIVPNARQQNIKQRFIALLKRFRVPEALQAFEQEDQRQDDEVVEDEIEELFHELEDLSDSGPEVDSISITSTPKPTLRPYFSSSRSLITEGIMEGLNIPDKLLFDGLSDESSKRADSDHMEAWTDQEQSDTQILASSPPRDDKGKSMSKLFARDRSNMSLTKEKRSGSFTPRAEKVLVERTPSTPNADTGQVRKVLLEHLTHSIPLDDDFLPEHLILMSGTESHCILLSSYLSERGYRIITTMTTADVKATIVHLVNKLQKFCNSNAKSPAPMKVIIIGSDTYINCVLRPYAGQFASKPPDFQNNFRFYTVPLTGVNSLSKYLASIDPMYGATFASDSWKDLLDHWENQDVQEAVSRIHRYIQQAACTVNLPIAEAMLTYREKSEDESSQVFIPFLTDVRLGSGDVTSTSVEADEPISPPSSNNPSSPPPVMTQSLVTEKPKENTTPPPSPNINFAHNNARNVAEVCDRDPLDLQVDYWFVRPTQDKEMKEKTYISKDSKDKLRSDSSKYTIKGIFRTLQVARLTPLGVTLAQDPNAAPSHHLTFSYATKEKKQRIMRLGKKKEKERESESRREVLDGICRLLASTRGQPLKVTIDSVEWTNVKFFQLSSQWQTQIKTFPISLFSLQDNYL